MNLIRILYKLFPIIFSLFLGYLAILQYNKNNQPILTNSQIEKQKIKKFYNKYPIFRKLAWLLILTIIGFLIYKLVFFRFNFKSFVTDRISYISNNMKSYVISTGKE